MLANLWIETRQAIRRLLGDARLTLTAILTLSLGLGAAVVMTDTLDRLLIRPPAHVAEANRITRLYVGHDAGFEPMTDYVTFEGLESELDEEIESVTAYFIRSFSLGRGAEARQVQAVAHSPQYFEALGVHPVLGSLAAIASEDPQSAAISYRLWQDHYSASPDVIGQTLRLGTDVFTISAVLPRGFSGVDFAAIDVWIPLSVAGPRWMSGSWRTIPYSYLNVIARLRHDVEREAAAVHATTVHQNLHETGPFAGQRLVFGDLKRSPEMTETTRVALWIGGIAVIVLLIACGNVATLLYVRGLARAHEMAIQTALGASRGRLVRGLLLEAALLSAASGIVALAIVATGGVVVRKLFLPTAAAFVSPLDWRLISLAVGACLGAMLLFGLLPALRLTTHRMTAPGQGASRQRHRLLPVFTSAQVALTVPLLVGAGLFVLSLSNAAHQNLGFEHRNVIIVETSLFEVGDDVQANTAAHRMLKAQLDQMPDIEATAMVKQEPWQSALGREFLSVPGRQQPLAAPIVPANSVDPAFFDVMRLPLVQGRLFSDAENTEGAAPVAVVSEAMARAIWPDESALDRCISVGFDRDAPCTKIVGVVGDARWSPAIRPTNLPDEIIFFPIEQSASTGSLNRTILARTSTDAARLLPLLRERLATDSNLPFIQIRTFDETLEPLLRPWRIGATIFVVFGLLALVIAAVGIGVVTSHDVTRRSHELAVRSACGAEAAALIRGVLSRSVGAVLIGLVVGTAMAFVGARLLESLLFAVAAADLRVFLVATAILLICSLMGAWLPALRAARIDPAAALRSE